DEESDWALEDATATLTATWTAKTTTVTLNLAGGTIEGETTITAKYGEVLTLNKPTKVGFVFVCWTLNGQNYDATSAWSLDAETATLVATWNDNPTVITIDVNGGNALPTESEIVYGNKGQVLTLPTVTKTGYNPAGWTLNGEAYDVDGEWTLEGGTAILVAQWTAKTTTVTLNLDGGTIEGNTTVIATYGQVLTLKEPTKGGYKFVRWLYNGQAIDLTQIWETDAESIELVAEYVGVTVKVTIKYDGFDVEASEQKVIFDGAYELKSTVAGYNISKLVIEDSETEVAVSGDNWAYSENVTLVATLAPKTYNVNIIGYYGEAIAQIVVTYGETVDFAKYLPTEGGFEVDEVIVSVEKFVYVNGVQKFFDGYKVEDAEYKFDLSKTSEAIWGYAFEGDDVTIRATYESEEIWI
ncbi:MAG: InlB B-repeat-containing protein, partial [Clostridia bacterium]|nr:InlB B-repeat-containing protein [Clostridia bacterium]